MIRNWIDATYTRYTILIGLQRLYACHAGHHLAAVMFNICQEYQIESNIGCVQADNVLNNKTMTASLYNQLPQGLTLKGCLYCAGHIINLVVKAIMFGNGVSAFEQDISDACDTDTFKIWRSCGVIGRVHNIVKYIMHSDAYYLGLWSFAKEGKGPDGEPLKYILTLVKDGGIR